MPDAITAERLRELVKYVPETGHFYWRAARTGRDAGKTKEHGLVGSWHDLGYRKACIDGKTYRVHRLAWLYMTGKWPTALIDHINQDKGDNRWENLRQATRSENARNNAGRNHRNSPLKGAYRRPSGRWGASIQLGVFDTPEEAHEAYMRAAKLFFGEYANGGKRKDP